MESRQGRSVNGTQWDLKRHRKQTVGTDGRLAVGSGGGGGRGGAVDSNQKGLVRGDTIGIKEKERTRKLCMLTIGQWVQERGWRQGWHLENNQGGSAHGNKMRFKEM